MGYVEEMKYSDLAARLNAIGQPQVFRFWQELTPDQQAQVSAGLEKNATAVSDAKVQEILEGQPPAVVDEVTRINAEARDRALGLALLSVAVIGLVGLGASFLLPASTSAEAATGPPKRPA